MRLAHFYAITPNFGDIGSAIGIQNILRSIQGDIEFIEFNIQKKDLKKTQVKEISQTCDAIILGGGGVLYNVPKKASLFNFNINFKHYKNILKIPKFFYGIGINAEYKKNEKWLISENTKRSIKLFSENTDIIGARDIETQLFFKDIGIEKVDLVPCPSMFLLKDSQVKKKDETFAVNLTHRVNDFNKLKELLKWILDYSEMINFKPILIVHHKSEDKPCMELARKIGMQIYIPTSPENLMEFYKKQQFLIGMRGHALIYATGAMLPMISISYNKKCDAHMDILEMNEFVININEINREILFSKLKSLLSRKEQIVDSLRKKREMFYKYNLSFSNRLLEKVKCK